MRLHLADLDQVVARHFLEGLVRGVAAEQAAGLHAVERSVAADLVGEMTQVEHVAEHAGHQEERQVRPTATRVHRHEVGEAGRSTTANPGIALGGVAGRRPRRG